uniref:Uncharacterized protein n=1 Tax=Ascaris lumbricoides TaxID=6252 RepID=A0A0M3I838_ASCLU
MSAERIAEDKRLCSTEVENYSRCFSTRTACIKKRDMYFWYLMQQRWKEKFSVKVKNIVGRVVFDLLEWSRLPEKCALIPVINF